MNRYKNSGGACSGWRAWWKSFRIALIGIVALPVCSCRTTRESTSIQKADSLRWDRRVSVILGAIPVKKLEWTLTPPDLHDLTLGERLTRQADGVKVSVGVEDGNLNITAETNPLPQMTYTEEISATKFSEESVGTLTEKEAATEPFKRCLNGIAVVLAFVLIILIVLKWQKRKQDRSA